MSQAQHQEPGPASPRPRAAVTGASSGIGAAYARRLAAEGYDLIVVARRGARLQELADDVARRHGTQVQAVVADLAHPGDVRGIEERLAADDHLALLVNNAGAAGYLPFAQLGRQQAEELIAVHVGAVTALTRAVLPGMLARGAGSIVNMASLLAFSESLPPDPLPYRAVYAAAKAYIVAFTETLHHETEGMGVALQACCPGVVATEFHEVAGIDRSRSPFTPMAADDVVTASLAALRLGERLCLPGLDDASPIDRYHATQRHLLFAANHATLAQRYRTTDVARSPG